MGLGSTNNTIDIHWENAWNDLLQDSENYIGFENLRNWVTDKIQTHVVFAGTKDQLFHRMLITIMMDSDG